MGQTTIVGWDFTGYTGAGASPQAPTTNNANLTVVGLTRGSALGTSGGTPAGNAWGTIVSVTSPTDAATAVAANSFATFSVKANSGFALSLSSISNYNVRRSGTGPTTGQWQFSTNGTTFTDIGSPITWGTTTTSSGNAQTAITLSGITALQNLPSSVTVVFRVAIWGATGISGTWYLNDFQTGNDFVVNGTVASDNPNAPQVTGFSPAAGVAGTLVTVSGTNFTGLTSVTFGSVAASVGSSSATNIQTTVPAGAITAPITVATPNGTNSSAQSFIILNGSGTATVQNATAPYTGRNIFPRSTPGQTLQVVFTPPAAGTIEGLQITVPAAFGAPVQGNVSVSGGGGSPVAAVSSQNVTITNLAATNPGNVTVSIAGLAMPDTATPSTNNGSYAVSVQSRGSGGAFAALASSPSALVTVPIANIRDISSNTNYIPNLLSNVVAVEGVATASRFQTNRGISAPIQDVDWGVAIDSSLTSVSSNLVRSNRYLALGTVTQFQGLVQVNVTNATNLVNLGAQVEPGAVVATVPQFTNPPTAYTNQSRVVRIENLTYVPGAAVWTTNTNATFVDQSGNTLTVYIAPASTATNAPPTNQLVTVVGVGGQSDTNAPFDTGWRLQPRDTNDIIVGATLLPVITSSNAATGTVGAAFNYNITASNSPTSYGASNLPSGLSVNSTNGLISGTPSAAGTFASTISASNSAGVGSTNLTITIAKGTPVISNAPTAAPIVEGQTLADSTLSGGSVSVPGAFSWTNTSIVPPIGTNTYGVTFAPTDGSNYNTAVTNAVVVVSSSNAPSLNVTPVSLSGFATQLGTNSAPPQTFSLSGTNLTGPVQIAAPNGFEISTNGTSFSSNVVVSLPSTPGTATTFTNSTNWVAPTNLSAVQVEAWGAGGAGGSAVKTTDKNAFAGGGAGGAYAKMNFVPVIPGSNYTVAVGLGGVSAVSPSLTNVPGGDSWFGSGSATNCLAKGGAGGETLINVGTNTLVGSGGVGSPSGSMGDVVFAGGSGAAGQGSAATPVASTGGGGGGSAGTNSAGIAATNYVGATSVAGGGVGGNGATNNANGLPGLSPGGGGGGARGSQTNTQRVGGTGGNGQIILTTFASSPVLPPTTIYVRMTGAVVGNFSNNVTVSSSGALTRNVAVSGTVSPPPPTVTVSTNSLPAFSTPLNVPSVFQPFTAGGSGLTSDITVTAPTNFAISFTNDGTGVTNSLVLSNVGGTASNRPVYVRMTGATNGSFSGAVTLVGGIGSNSVAVSGTVLLPVVTVSTNSLLPFVSVTNQPSAAQFFTAGGSNLSTNITVTAPEGFSLSFVESPFAASNSLVLSNAGGSASNRPVYVRMSASSVTNSVGPTNVNLTSVGASNFVTVRGTNIDAVPALTANPASLTNFFTVAGRASTATNFVLAGSNLFTAISVTAPAGFQIALTNTSSAFTNTVAPVASGGVLNTNIWVRVASSAATNTNLTGVVTNTAGTSVTNVTLQARVVPAPTLSADPTSLSNFTTVTGIASTNQSFNLTASNLLGPVTMTVTNGYEISLGTNSGFGTSLSVATVSAADNAANYSGGWTNGANGGTGFGPWNLTSSGGTGGFGGFIVGNPAAAGIVGMSSNSFGLFANPTGSGSFANAERVLSNALAVGQTLTFQWGINFESGGGGNKGFNLLVGTNEIVNVNNAGSEVITLNGSNVGFGYGTNAMTWSFTRTASNALSITANDRDGVGTYTTNITVASAAINTVKFYASAMQPGDPAQPYFNDLQTAFAGGNISNLPIYVRIATNAPVAETTNSLVSRVTISSTNATNIFVNLSGTVEERSITRTPSALTNFIADFNTPSAAQSFDVGAIQLVNEIEINAPSKYEISLTNTGNFTNLIKIPPPPPSSAVKVWVRLKIGASVGPADEEVTLTSIDAATKQVSLTGEVLDPIQPARNEDFIYIIHQLLLYRLPDTNEVAKYSSTNFLGSLGGFASNTQKSKVIMDIMGYQSTNSPFPWATAYNLTNDYTKSASVLFAFYSRLGLVPTLSQNQTLIKEFVLGVITNTNPVVNLPVSAGLGSATLAPGTATTALATNMQTFIDSSYFRSNQGGITNYTLQIEPTGFNFVDNWLRPNFPAAFNAPTLRNETIGMLKSYGMTSFPTNSSTNSFAQAAGISLYSIWSQAVLTNTPRTDFDQWRSWQLKLSQTGLNFQLWGTWGSLSSELSQPAVTSLLRPPVVITTNVVATTGVTFSNYIEVESYLAPVNSAIYYAMSNRPVWAHITTNGYIIGTPTAPGNYTSTVTAQNIAGWSQPQQVILQVTGSSEPSQAATWMAANYPPGTNTLYNTRNDDTDGDGFSSASEYAFGSNPNVPNASQMSFSNVSANVMRIRWNGLTNQNYFLSVSTNLLAGWTNRSMAVATNGAVFITNGVFYQPYRTDVTNSSGASNEFYRIWTEFTQQQLE